MKRLKKRELLSPVGTLEKANLAIGRNGGGISKEDAVNMLAECQEVALFLGNYLETLGEEASFLVRILEEYCEELYRMSLVTGNASECRKKSKKVKKLLIQLREGIRYQLPADRKVIVFLPYKASMWDSMESVWRAASEDESCEVYVVPIPYFDKNPDGTFGRLHDEGGEYPGYVPVTSWKEYKIEEQKPDIVYIHNPYDECNYVTSVHPAFYAKELKKHTPMLVYIPYFVVFHDDMKEQLCVLPGIIHADRVVVQSEAVKQTYVRAIYKAEKENHCEGALGNPMKKVLALGSPKYDKVANTGIKDLTVPEEWENIIRRADGTRKKIIFYNISVTDLLEQSDETIEKIEDTLKIFKRAQEDTALLWRPHPLIPATLRSMRPQLWERYQNIVSRYREEGWGIYDDSGDVDRAVILSDAYYGDGGSVYELYGKTKKPMMRQNALVLHTLAGNE